MQHAPPTVYVCDDVRAVLDLHADLFTDDFRRLPIREQLDRQARRIADAHAKGDRAVYVHVTCWHPQLVGHSPAQIAAAPVTLDDARETIAREYGFRDWAEAETRGTQPPNPDFEAAVDALLAGDLDTLRELLEKTPALVRAASDYGHRATLLHYVGSNGVETYRQVVPSNLPAVAQMLLDAGAEVDAPANMYGADCTTLGLVLTSSHPHEAGIAEDVVQLLVRAGAKTDDG